MRLKEGVWGEKGRLKEGSGRGREAGLGEERGKEVEERVEVGKAPQGKGQQN